MNPLKPNQQRGKLAIAMLWIVLAVQTIAILSQFFQYRMLLAMQDGERFSDAAINANDDRQQLISILYLITMFVSVVTFILWFRRAYYNLHQRAETLSYTEGWAAGSWFVPFLNLVRPYKIMTEMYRETETLLFRKSGYIAPYYGTFIGAWWALWIVGKTTERIVGKINTDTIEGLMNFSLGFMLMGIAWIPLTVLAVKVVKNYADMEQLLFESSQVPELASENIGTEDLSREPLA